MNDLYQSSYLQPIYTPIYQANIIFTEEEDIGTDDGIAEA